VVVVLLLSLSRRLHILLWLLLLLLLSLPGRLQILLWLPVCHTAS
jgi:hypothetical protein